MKLGRFAALVLLLLPMPVRGEPNALFAPTQNQLLVKAMRDGGSCRDEVKYDGKAIDTVAVGTEITLDKLSVPDGCVAVIFDGALARVVAGRGGKVSVLPQRRFEISEDGTPLHVEQVAASGSVSKVRIIVVTGQTVDFDQRRYQDVPLGLGTKTVALDVDAGSRGVMELVNELSVTAPRRITVSISRLPPSRVRANFDSENGSHVDVEWDPNLPTGLTKTVTLSADGTWRVSFWAEPVFISSADAAQRGHYLTVHFEPHARGKDAGAVGGAVGRFVDVFDQTIISDEIMPALRISLHAETGLISTQTARRSLRGMQGYVSGRSLNDQVPQAVSDLLQIFAEIAFERAKAAAFQILTARITQFVCVDLQMPRDAVTQLWSPAGAGASSGSGSPLLPRTCDVVKHIRIQDIATSAKPLLSALLGDMTAFALQEVGDEMTKLLQKNDRLKPWSDALSPLIAQVSAFGAQLAESDTQLNGREGQQLIVALSAVDWSTLANKAAAGLPPTEKDEFKYAACGLELAFAVMSECHALGGCDARAIADMVHNPADHFAEEKANCFTPTSGNNPAQEILKQWPGLEQLISRGLDIIAPPKTATPRLVLRAAVNLVFDVLDGIAAFEAKHATAVNATDSDQLSLLVAVLHDMRAVADGVIDRDVQPILLAAASLVREIVAAAAGQTRDCTAIKDSELGRECLRKTTQMMKLTQLVGAVAAYAATYAGDTKADAEAIKAQHEARKKALESLIDSTTNRTNRDGDVVVSVGASVGFMTAGRQWLAVDGYAGQQVNIPQLSLPMGVALDWLPDRTRPVFNAPPDTCWILHHLGLHLQLSPIDLANFVAFNTNNDSVSPVTWSNFVIVGVQAGLIVGTPSLPFIIGFDGRWSPTLFTDTSKNQGGAWRAGLFIGYYIPFFDFN